MSDIIFVPCCKRPEFLRLCIDQIMKTEEAKNMTVLFHVDFHYTAGIMNVIKSYPYPKETIINKRHAFRNKLPVNILEGYRKACEMSSEYVFMIEEDVLISNDFFKWHYRIHEDEGGLFCSIASKNNNLNKRLKIKDNLNNYYTSHATYQSLGVCFKKNVIIEHILPHAHKHYYGDNRGYCFKHFPKSRLGKNWCEQAGLIRRIQETKSMAIAYPFTPRSYHAGFYGKNRKGRSFTAQKLKLICFDAKLMKQHAIKENYYTDSIPVNLTNGSWDGVKKIIHYAN